MVFVVFSNKNALFIEFYLCATGTMSEKGNIINAVNRFGIFIKVEFFEIELWR